MARSRLIRPEFWNDEKLARLSRDARLTFIGLWTASDDYGVAKGHHCWLKSQIFPYDEDIKLSDFGKWINELLDIGAIAPFEANDESYYFIRTFNKHQKVDHPSTIRNPEPPEDIREWFANGSRLIRAQTETETETETIYTDIFDSFWKIYPRRNGKIVGKKQCMAWWKKNVTSQEIADSIINGATNFSKSKQAIDGFAKDPIRFLKHELYDDWQKAEETKKVNYL